MTRMGVGFEFRPDKSIDVKPLSWCVVPCNYVETKRGDEANLINVRVGWFALTEKFGYAVIGTSLSKRNSI